VSFTDPEKRFQLFKKADESNKTRGVQAVQKRKEKPRVDYFSGKYQDFVGILFEIIIVEGSCIDRNYRVEILYTLRGNFFQCHVFAMKSVFWRSSQNYFVLALFSSL
jgi:hypothetical protein